MEDQQCHYLDMMADFLSKGALEEVMRYSDPILHLCSQGFYHLLLLLLPTSFCCRCYHISLCSCSLPCLFLPPFGRPRFFFVVVAAGGTGKANLEAAREIVGEVPRLSSRKSAKYVRSSSTRHGRLVLSSEVGWVTSPDVEVAVEAGAEAEKQTLAQVCLPAT